MKRSIYFYATPFLASVILLIAAPAQAYLGPGAGLGMIGSLIALVVVVLVLVFGLILYPIRRFLKRKTPDKKA